MQKNKRILNTRAFQEAYEFILKNKDSKVKKMDLTGKAKIMDKRKFIIEFYDASKKQWEDKQKVFRMTDILIKRYSNKNHFLNILGLKKDYTEYNELMADKL